MSNVIEQRTTEDARIRQVPRDRPLDSPTVWAVIWLAGHQHDAERRCLGIANIISRMLCIVME